MAGGKKTALNTANIYYEFTNYSIETYISV